MTSLPPTKEPWVSHSCTLSTIEQPPRMPEFDKLFHTAVTGQERTAATTLRLTLTSDPETATTPGGQP